MDQENIDLLPLPSTSQGDSNAAVMLISTENIDDDDDEEEDSFTDQQLFSFSWQIAKGMVIMNFFSFFAQDFYVVIVGEAVCKSIITP